MYGQDKVAQYGGEDQVRGQMMGTIAGMAQQRQPEVRTEMDRLDKAVGMLLTITDTLTERLNPIRSQTGNALAAGRETNPPEPVLCVVADYLRTQRQRVEAAQQLLQRAFNELEI